jgi:hypothetical protein
MAFIRTIKQENPFVQIDKYFLEEDNQLSWKAKGLLAYLLSRPNNWKVNHKDLVNRAKESKNTVTTILKELENVGYIHYYQERLEGGKFGSWIYDVYERPQFNPSKQGFAPYPNNRDTVKKPCPENRDTDKRDTDKRDTDNWDYNNNDLNDIDFNNINPNNIKFIEEEKDFQINNFAFNDLVKEFNETYPNKYDNILWKLIYQEMIEQKIDVITFKEAVIQARAMQKSIEDGKIIADYSKYFVGGIKRKRTSKHSALVSNKMSKYNLKKPQKENENIVPFYNWLDQ